MNVMKLNGVKVYNLTANRSLPEWASRAEKRRLFSRDASLSRHIELIQELEMPDSCTYITSSQDGRYLFTLGRYKPRVRCYELSNLSLKFDRCVDYLPYRMELLSDDYSKFVLLEEERWVDVHAAGGHYFKFRVPKPGVDTAYCPFTSDLFITSSRSTIYRMNLCEGRFNTPLVSKRLEGTPHGFTCSTYSREHNLLLASSTMGCIDGWDTRTGDNVFGLRIATHENIQSDLPQKTNTGKRLTGITSMSYKDALNIGVGTSDGMVYIYDLRQNRTPWHCRDTEFRQPVKNLSFYQDKVMATLPHCLKIWNVDTGQIFVGFDTGRAECNWMHHFANSGLFMLAMESPKVATYFIPLLGEAPAWCSHLDQLVVECEPDVATMYDGYKFVTRQQLSEFGMLELIGSQFLRAYMHGYFISTRLFNKVRDKLGLSDHRPTSANDQIKRAKISETPDNRKDAEYTARVELDEAAADTRFAKLTRSENMTIDARQDESDLIKIHQARLVKKRKRKEQRVERASRAHKLVSEKT